MQNAVFCMAQKSHTPVCRRDKKTTNLLQISKTCRIFAADYNKLYE
jgi:hypothetical protein